MRRPIILAALALLLLTPARALAQAVRGEGAAPPPPAEGAIELTLGTGYARGLGATGSPDPATAASDSVAVRFGAGVRVESWSVAIAGTYERSAVTGEHDANALGAAALATWHLAPERRVDPWVEAGAGYRRLWATNAAGHGSHADAVDLLEVLVGADLRASDLFVAGPAVGATLTLYPAGGLGGLVFAGLEGRFELFASPSE